MKILFALSFLIGSCQQLQWETDTKILDFGAFTIDAPTGWRQIETQGVDSYAGRIAIDEKDTLRFDLGWYSYTLDEPEPYIVERRLLKDFANPDDTADMIIVESKKGMDPDRYRKNIILWDTIDGRKAKIVFPVKSGIGMTGVYIDSLWRSGSDVDRFNLYGEN